MSSLGVKVLYSEHEIHHSAKFKGFKLKSSSFTVNSYKMFYGRFFQF